MLDNQFAEAGHKVKHINTVTSGCTGASNEFCCVSISHDMSGTFYTTMTGEFPLVSLGGKQYHFVVHDYDTSTILAKPIPDLKDKTIIVIF